MIEGTLNRAKYREILNDNLFMTPKASDWVESSPSNMTMIPNTKPRQHRSGLGTTVNVLEWHSQSPDLNAIKHVWRGLKMSVHQWSPSNLTGLEGIRKEWQKTP